MGTDQLPTTIANMKVLALLLATLALASAMATKDSPNCWCGAFIELPDDIHKVWRLESAFLDSCDMVDEFKAICASEFDIFTGGGDLGYVLESGYTVGQELCLYMAQHQGVHNIMNAYVYGYANMCNGPWIYDGVSTTGKLCCKEGANMPC